jgi:EpsI family protein
MKTSLRYLSITVLMFLAAGYMATHHDQATPLAKPLNTFPLQLGDWKMTQDTQFGPDALELLKPSAYIARRYQRLDGAVAELYVGYHDGARQSGEIHSPKNCLPGSGWYLESSEPMRFQLADGRLEAIAAVYKKDEVAELFIYWFMVGGKTEHNEYAMRYREVVHSILEGRRDASLIRISVPVGQNKSQAMEQAKAFMEVALPQLKEYLPM